MFLLNPKISRIGALVAKPWALRAYLLLALVGACWALAKNLDVVLLPTELYWGYALLVGLSVLVFWIVLAMVWKLNLKLTVGAQIGFATAFRQVVMLLMGKYLPGKVWGVFARGGDGSVHLQIPASASYVAAYLEQLISVHAGCLFGLGLMAMAYPAEQWLGVFFLLSLSSLVLVPRFHHRILKWLMAGLLKKQIHVLAAMSGTAISLRDYWLLFFAYLGEWLATGFILVAVQLLITGVWPSGEVLVLLLGSYSIAMVVGFLAIFAPGGVGVREGVLVVLLTPMLGVEPSAQIAVVTRVVSVASDLIATMIATIIIWRSR